MPILKKNVDIMTLGMGHSQLVGNIPKKIDPQQFSEKFYEASKVKATMENFGFWGGDIDYNTYYPDVTMDDLKPSQDEFIEPMFRLLSATIVSKNYCPTDFSKNSVLKNSMPLLIGQTVNCDHETAVGNAIGSIKSVVWQNSYTQDGVNIPAGINGVLRIDGKANPRIARGIMMDPPSIHSESVTVRFAWEKSHKDIDDQDFYYQLGTYGKDGEMVRRIATEIIGYSEASLVSAGADFYAKILGDDGKIIRPQESDRKWNSFSEYNDDQYKRYFFIDSKGLNKEDTTMKNSNHEDNTKGNIINKNNSEQMDELQKFLQSIFGQGMLTLSEGTPTTEIAMQQIAAAVSQLQAKDTEIASLKEQLQNSNTEVTNLKADAEKNKSLVSYAEKAITSLREETLASYKKLYADEKEQDQNIVSLISSAAPETLVSLKSMYEKSLQEKFPLHCNACGSKDVSRASSVKPEETQKNSDKTSPDVNPEEALYRKKIK